MSSIGMKHGSEGPTHDPYSYTEILVTREDGTEVMLHDGLATWIEINGERIDPQHGPGYDVSCQSLRNMFERRAGCSIPHLEKAYQRVQYTCKKCGGSELREQAGYPGETFHFCVRCDIVVSCDFNESAIM